MNEEGKGRLVKYPLPMIEMHCCETNEKHG